MTLYKKDRQFTDYVHSNLAIPIIYKILNWTQINLNKNYAKNIDMYKGIDYICENEQKDRITIAERFREIKYQNYNDFTIRYRRDNNRHLDRKKSEFYKLRNNSELKANFMIYGIVNGSKNQLNECTKFIKFAVINVENLYKKINSNEIYIKDNNENKCKLLHDKKIECPIKYNIDGSSTFIPFEIPFIYKLWGSEIIVAQKGFI